jgi:hypothetical protein
MEAAALTGLVVAALACVVNLGRRARGYTRVTMATATTKPPSPPPPPPGIFLPEKRGGNAGGGGSR